MGPEARLYKKLKRVSKDIVWTRIENQSLFGTPDLLGYNINSTFFTVELKVTKGIKIKFSPHQIAWHVKHPKNTFILVEALGPRSVNRFQLFPGSGILALEACGLKLEPFCLGLDACSLLLDAGSVKSTFSVFSLKTILRGQVRVQVQDRTHFLRYNSNNRRPA